MHFADWLNVVQQFPVGQYPDFLGGRVVSVDGACAFGRREVVDAASGEVQEAWALVEDGPGLEVDFSTAKFARHRGSFETGIMVRLVGGKLEVRGNPSSFGRLDNLFGLQLDDCISVYNCILASLGLPEFTAGEVTKREDQASGKMVMEYSGAKITRVDYTVNQSVGMGRVADYNRWLAGQKISRSGPTDDDLEKFARWDYSTVYTSNSKFWVNVKHYDKARALEEVTLPQYLKSLKKNARTLEEKKSIVSRYKEAEDYICKLAEWCAEKGIVRTEISFRSRFFAQADGLGYWEPDLTDSRIYEHVEAEMMKISNRAVVYQEEDFSSLTPAEFKAFSIWKKGTPLRVSQGGASRKDKGRT